MRAPCPICGELDCRHQRELLPRNRARDTRITAERQWSAPLKAPAPQKACDVGLFSDTHKQTEMFK